MSKRLEKAKICLPEAPPKGGKYASVKELGNNVWYISGCGPNTTEKVFSGKLGHEFDLKGGKEAARATILNFLASLDKHIGNLDNVKSFIKLQVYVASTENFYQQPQVADAATALLEEIFGEEVGLPARSAIGVTALPGNIPVEIDGIVIMSKE